MRSRTLGFLFVTTLLAVCSLSGCLIEAIPVKIKPIAVDSTGNSVAPPLLPVIGSTTQEEVEENLKDIKVDLGVPSLYWARVYKSSYGSISLPHDSRWWESVNIVITFDSRHLADRVVTFSDTKLPSEVKSMLADGRLPPLDLNIPIAFQSEEPEGSPPWLISLTRSSALFTIPEKIKKKNVVPGVTVRIPSEEVQVAVSSPDLLAASPDSSGVAVELRFKHKNKAVGSVVRARVPFIEALKISRWIAQIDAGSHPSGTADQSSAISSRTD